MQTKGIGVVDVVVGAVGSTPATSGGGIKVLKMPLGGNEEQWEVIDQ